MWLAVERGKVSIDPKLLRCEDVATAAVFGRLRYLPWAEGIGAWLGSLGIATSNGVVEFWSLQDGTEPDVVIRADGVAVLVEVKVDAPFGVRQLGREWRWLVEHGDGARLQLLVLARDLHDAGELHDQVVEDLAALGSTAQPPDRDGVRSTSWSRLARWAKERRRDAAPHADAVFADVLSYLEWHGLSIEPFEGWHATSPPVLPDVGSFLAGTGGLRLFSGLTMPGRLPAGGWLR